MRIATNTTRYSARAMKTVATRVYTHLRRELTPGQLERIGWKTLCLHIHEKKKGRERCVIRSKIELAIRNPRTEPLSEYTFAYYVSALLCWRAEMKNLWKTGENFLATDEFSLDKTLALQAPRKSRPKPETPEVVRLRKEFEKTGRAMKRIESRLDKLKKEAQSIKQRQKRGLESLKIANKKYRKAKAAYLKASEQTVELDNNGFAARMRARRDGETDAPASR